MTSPYVNIYTRMQFYGIVLGAIAGVLVTLALRSQVVLENPLYFGYVIFMSAPVGGVIGMFFGGLVGCVSGVVMMVTTSVFFKRIPTQRVYRIMMGLLSFVLTTILVIKCASVDISNLIPESEFARPLYIAIILAVYASQIVAKEHIAEINERKPKLYSA